MTPVIRFLKDKRNDDFQNTLKITRMFLEAGARTNNITRNNKSLEEFLVVGQNESNIQLVKDLISEFPDNIEEIVSFDIAELNKLSRSPFKYIDEVVSQLKMILLKKKIYNEIFDISYVITDKNDLFFKVNNDTIVIPEENISGNDFTNNSYKRID